jgi:pimeloyl-ACP methyl ester carboxylesterase
MNALLSRFLFFLFCPLALPLSLASCTTSSQAVPMSQEPPRPSSSTAPAAQLFFDDGGPAGKVPVVFLHSSGGDTRHFTAQLAHLRRSRRAIAVDLPGHGQSPPAASFEIPAVADVLAQALAAHGLDRVVLVGHSWGGAVALALAAQAPQRVAGLLLLDPASDGTRIPKPEADGLMASLRTSYEAVLSMYWASMLEGATPEVRERLMREIMAAPREVVIGTLASLLTFDPLPSLQRYRGARRTLFTHLNERPDAYQQLVKDLPSQRIDGTGHWLQLDKPDEINAAIDDFLTEVDPH